MKSLITTCVTYISLSECEAATALLPPLKLFSHLTKRRQSTHLSRLKSCLHPILWQAGLYGVFPKCPDGQADSMQVCVCVCRYPVQYVPVSVCFTETTWSLLVKAIRWLESYNILWDAAHRGFEGWLTGWNLSFLLLATFTCEDYTTLAITREMWINLWPGFILAEWLSAGEKSDWSESFRHQL